MEIVFTTEAENDLTYWKRTNNTLVLKRIRLLLENILETPYGGIGKPEALKHELSGKWSRRITKTDRLIYQVIENKVFVFSLKGHYE
ncbi:MAG: Txe/YoeB family addiction module toxin [Methylococcaceae bacterium]|nr:Txe/YoeB family addiction module toxin [Prolixibacteraceae bacterium]